jgi:hypothetical protein
MMLKVQAVRHPIGQGGTVMQFRRACDRSGMRAEKLECTRCYNKTKIRHYKLCVWSVVTRTSSSACSTMALLGLD